jgi:putative membrane protein
MTGLLIRFAFAAGGLWAASQLIPGISVDGVGSLLWAAFILGIINAVVRPVLILLTLPISILTLGLFLLVINAGMLMLTAALLHGFHVHGFWAALWGSILVSVISWIGAITAQKMKRRSQGT